MLASHAPCFADPDVRIRTTMRSDRVSRNTGLPNAFLRPLVSLDARSPPGSEGGAGLKEPLAAESSSATKPTRGEAIGFSDSHIVPYAVPTPRFRDFPRRRRHPNRSAPI